ncbi:MAG: phosphotransferase, partial [Micrococcaceae bacterium]|nr:phosphotransferase [Micrococcaceae bacterium]
MRHDQIPIDVPTAQALIRQQFPHLRSEPIRFLPSTGTVNAIFRVGDLLAARFPLHESDPAELAESLSTDADAMGELAGRSPVPTPTCVGLGRPDKSYPLPFTLQTWIPGHVATPTKVSDSPKFAADLARFVQALPDSASFGGFPVGGSDTLSHGDLIPANRLVDGGTGPQHERTTALVSARLDAPATTRPSPVSFRKNGPPR